MKTLQNIFTNLHASMQVLNIWTLSLCSDVICGFTFNSEYKQPRHISGYIMS